MKHANNKSPAVDIIFSELVKHDDRKEITKPAMLKYANDRGNMLSNKAYKISSTILWARTKL